MNDADNECIIQQVTAAAVYSWDPSIFVSTVAVSFFPFRPHTPGTPPSTSDSSCIITSTALIHMEAAIVCFYRWLSPVKIPPWKQWIPNRAKLSLRFVSLPKLSSVKTAEEGKKGRKTSRFSSLSLFLSTLPSRQRRCPFRRKKRERTKWDGEKRW